MIERRSRKLTRNTRNTKKRKKQRGGANGPGGSRGEAAPTRPRRGAARTPEQPARPQVLEQEEPVDPFTDELNKTVTGILKAASERIKVKVKESRFEDKELTEEEKQHAGQEGHQIVSVNEGPVETYSELFQTMIDSMSRGNRLRITADEGKDTKYYMTPREVNMTDWYKGGKWWWEKFYFYGGLTYDHWRILHFWLHGPQSRANIFSGDQSATGYESIIGSGSVVMSLIILTVWIYEQMEYYKGKDSKFEGTYIDRINKNFKLLNDDIVPSTCDYVVAEGSFRLNKGKREKLRSRYCNSKTAMETGYTDRAYEGPPFNVYDGDKKPNFSDYGSVKDTEEYSSRNIGRTTRELGKDDIEVEDDGLFKIKSNYKPQWTDPVPPLKKLVFEKAAGEEDKKKADQFMKEIANKIFTDKNKELDAIEKEISAKGIEDLQRRNYLKLWITLNVCLYSIVRDINRYPTGKEEEIVSDLNRLFSILGEYISNHEERIRNVRMLLPVIYSLKPFTARDKFIGENIKRGGEDKFWNTYDRIMIPDGDIVKGVVVPKKEKFTGDIETGDIVLFDEEGKVVINDIIDPGKYEIIDMEGKTEVIEKKPTHTNVTLTCDELTKILDQTDLGRIPREKLKKKRGIECSEEEVGGEIEEKIDRAERKLKVLFGDGANEKIKGINKEAMKEKGDEGEVAMKQSKLEKLDVLIKSKEEEVGEKDSGRKELETKDMVELYEMLTRLSEELGEDPDKYDNIQFNKKEVISKILKLQDKQGGKERDTTRKEEAERVRSGDDLKKKLRTSPSAQILDKTYEELLEVALNFGIESKDINALIGKIDGPQLVEIINEALKKGGDDWSTALDNLISYRKLLRLEGITFEQVVIGIDRGGIQSKVQEEEKNHWDNIGNGDNPIAVLKDQLKEIKKNVYGKHSDEDFIRKAKEQLIDHHVRVKTHKKFKDILVGKLTKLGKLFGDEKLFKTNKDLVFLDNLGLELIEQLDVIKDIDITNDKVVTDYLKATMTRKSRDNLKIEGEDIYKLLEKLSIISQTIQGEIEFVLGSDKEKQFLESGPLKCEKKLFKSIKDALNILQKIGEKYRSFNDKFIEAGGIKYMGGDDFDVFKGEAKRKIYEFRKTIVEYYKLIGKSWWKSVNYAGQNNIMRLPAVYESAMRKMGITNYEATEEHKLAFKTYGDKYLEKEAKQGDFNKLDGKIGHSKNLEGKAMVQADGLYRYLSTKKRDEEWCELMVRGCDGQFKIRGAGITKGGNDFERVTGFEFMFDIFDRTSYIFNDMWRGDVEPDGCDGDKKTPYCTRALPKDINEKSDLTKYSNDKLAYKFVNP